MVIHDASDLRQSLSDELQVRAALQDLVTLLAMMTALY